MCVHHFAEREREGALRLTGPDDLWEPQLLALCCVLAKEERIFLFHSAQRTSQWLHRNEHA